MRVEETIKNETKYIAYFSILLSVIMQIVFVLLKKWDYTVLLGNLLSLSGAVLNFYYMGISIQKAINMETADAKKLMKTSQGIRNVFMFALLAIGVITPIFNAVAVIVPVFFPRVAVSFRPLIKDRKEVIDK